MFAVWDVDDDGHISAEDMRHVLSTMVGTQMTPGEIQIVISRTFQAAGLTTEDKITLHQFAMVRRGHTMDNEYFRMLYLHHVCI